MSNTMANLKSLPYGSAQYVVCQDLIQLVNQSMHEAINTGCLADTEIQKQFLTAYLDWIKSSQLNRLQGLENFPITAFSAGTTEAFDKFYLRHTHRRLRYFKGEYMYHQVAGRQYFSQAKFVEDADLNENDVLVISLPFADTGNEHASMQTTLQTCTRLGIPVLVDCAYFGICSDIDFDFSHDCISDITFSLSKVFPVPHLRIGMRLTRHDDDDALLVLNKTNYTNRLSSAVGLSLIQKFSPDYIYQKYQKRQLDFCEQLKIKPSKCVIFGIDTIGQYAQYNRGGSTNRLCLSKHLDTI